MSKMSPNQSPEPTAVGAVCAAVAVPVMSRRRLSYVRRHRMRRLNLISIISALLVAGCATHNSEYPPPHVAASTEPGVYIVQPGDSAPKIIAQFHLTLARLSVLNPGVALSPLKIGQKLFISEETSK